MDTGLLFWALLEDRYTGGHFGEYKGSFQLCKKKENKGI